MLSFLDRIGWVPLAFLAFFMAMAPFAPMPHAVEKISMLLAGELTNPVDIFDLFFHLAPTLLILVKIARLGGKTDRHEN